jgi:hypothetical protein
MSGYLDFEQTTNCTGPYIDKCKQHLDRTGISCALSVEADMCVGGRHLFFINSESGSKILNRILTDTHGHCISMYVILKCIYIKFFIKLQACDTRWVKRSKVSVAYKYFSPPSVHRISS